MLVEINLLPKKEKNSKMVVIGTAAALGIAIVSALILYFQYTGLQQQAASLDKQILTMQELAVLEQQKAEENAAGNAVQSLKEFVEWSETYPVKTVPLLDHITALLPERGFLKGIEYIKEGVIVLEVQFDTSREASAYLSAMSKSEWTKQAKLLTLTVDESVGEEPENESEEGGNNTPSYALDNEPYMPRYLGEFEIIIDTGFINDLEAGKNQEEGGES